MVTLIFLCGAFMLAILFWGVFLVFEPDPQDKKLGVCVSAWAGVALYLFVFQWLFVPRHEVVSLLAIVALSTAGYLVGRTITWLTRWEWIKEDDLRPSNERRLSS